MLSDALPTGHETGVLNGEIKPGDTVAIVGAGPVGMSCLLTSQLYSSSVIIMIGMDESVNFSVEKLWIKNLTITTGLVNANTTGMLMKNCCSGKLTAGKLITHHFRFSEIEKAYDVFKHAASEKAMKVIIEF
ncbi:hypothetical protein [Salmonella enterica]|uniref:hypothetical protein n=1 Tax=Salmonella enterica TaxID=28901 RepID=UPI001E2F02CF|nr:hypothetical protein [Salmonella enterica]